MRSFLRCINRARGKIQTADVMKTLIASHTRNIFLKPGEVVVAYEPALISSVLGSCVAVTMFSPSLRIGAICHAMLPDCGGRVDDLRYVDNAVPYIYRRMRECGAIDLVVKLFGGAQVLDAGSYDVTRNTVGEMNVARSKMILASLGLVIAAQDTGGFQGRKLYFCTRDGAVYLHRMGKKERSYGG
jgi:chemotaxis protein CheD